jgi:DNA repair protein RecO (recombination protein O)
MPLVTSEAIVLRKTGFRDADMIITFFTPAEGKLAGLARGVRRLRSRYGPALEVLTHGSLIYFDRQGKNLVTVNNFDIIHSFQKIRENLLCSASAQYLAELVLGFIPERAGAPEVFSLFLAALKALQGCEDPEPILRIFEIRFLALTGFGPHMDGCVGCGASAAAVRFSLAQGGVLCPRCEQGTAITRPISRGAVVFWNQALRMNLDRIDRVRLQKGLNGELRRLTHRVFVSHLGREIRTFTFLERIRQTDHGLTGTR